MKDKIVILLLILAAFLLGLSINSSTDTMQEKSIKKESQPVKYVLKSETKNSSIDEATRIKKTIKTKTVDFTELDKIFYNKLLTCEKLNIATKNGYLAYIIEGIEDSNCHFTHKEVGFMDTVCVLPLDISRRYAEEGLKEVKQLEELKTKNQTGLVQSSNYITEIMNNKNYCKFEYYQKK